MTVLKKWWFWTFISLLVIGGVVFIFYKQSSAKTEFVFDTVKKGTLEQTVEATGELESAQKVDLAFNTGGVIADLFVQVGDSVDAGAVLAQLDISELSSKVGQAQYVLQSAEAKYALEQAGVSAETKAVSDAAVGTARAALFAAQTDLKNSQEELSHTKQLYDAKVEEALLDMNTAEDSLNNSLLKNEQEHAELYEDLVNILRGNMIAVRSVLSDADEILGIDNPFANNDYQDLLGANDWVKRSAAERAYKTAKLSRDSAEEAIYALRIDSAEEDISDAANLAAQALEDTAETLLYTRQTLDATNIDTNDFSYSDLSALKTTIDTARNAVQTEQISITGQLQLISSKAVSHQSDKDAKTNAFNEAKQAYQRVKRDSESAVSASEANVRSAEAAVELRNSDLNQAQLSFYETAAGPRAVDLAPLAADVEQARQSLAAEEARLAKAQIVSPISGTVTDIPFEIGEHITLGEKALTVQTTDEQFSISVDMPEADIAKVSLGDRVEITFDAFGDDTLFTGLVSAIDPAEHTIENVVYYTVDILLDSGQLAMSLKPGMSADVAILTEHIEQTLFVAQRAVLEKPDGSKYVRIPQANGYQDQPVKVGLRADNGQIEILEGLEEDQQIIITIRD